MPDQVSDSTSKSRLSREDFEIDSLLGDGAFCKVYLARNKRTNERVALKVIQKQKLQTSSSVKMVLTERNILTRLKYHPNVIWLWSTFQDSMYLYFVLDYASGGPLEEVLVRYRDHQINASLSLLWVCDVINILGHLRSNRIIHRDIKVSQVL